MKSRCRRSLASGSPPSALRSPLLLALVLPLLLGIAEVPRELDKRRQRIAEMSRAEREKVDEQLRAYRKLSPDEQRRLAALDAAVAANPGLKQTLKDYEAWLEQLTPWERQRLREESDPVRKKNLVQTIRDERRAKAEKSRQEQERLDAEWEAELNRNLAGVFGQRKPPSPRFRPNPHAMMRVLQESLPPDAVAASQLNALDAPTRYLEVLRLALQANSNSPDFRKHPLSAEVIQKMLATIESEERREGMARFMEGDQGPQIFVSMLSRDIQFLWWEQAGRRRLSRDQLEQLKEKLEPHWRSEYDRLAKDSPTRAQVYLLYRLNLADFAQAMKGLEPLLEQIGIPRGRRPR